MCWKKAGTVGAANGDKYLAVLCQIITPIAILLVFIMILIVATYHAPLGNMFGYMMDNFFIAAFFPNLAIYFAALVAMNIILWISLFNYRTSNSIKTLNLAVYVIMNYLLALILNIINSNKLDIFEQSSVYGNKQATALIELSSLVFIIWILFLIIYTKGRSRKMLRDRPFVCIATLFRSVPRRLRTACTHLK